MLRLKNTESYGYDDLLLVPKEGILEHRSDADISTWLTPELRIGIPIVSAPMKSVTEWKMANLMAHFGGLGVIHRFMSIEEHVTQYMRAAKGQYYEYSTSPKLVACALGVKDEDRERFERLYAQGCRIFCIDIAHAHTGDAWDMTHYCSGGDTQIIVGNVGTAEGAEFLQAAGADCIKVGIGPGAACTTRTVTGFGSPMLSAISEIADVVDVPVMADGGIKNSGDIVKALAAGADTVMIGRLFAGCPEAAQPGEYYGMASKRMNGHAAPEGVEGTVEETAPLGDVLKTLTWGIRSGISYGGGKDIYGLQQNAEWQPVGYGTHVETSTRL